MKCDVQKTNIALAALLVLGLVNPLAANDQVRPFRATVIAQVVGPGPVEDSLNVAVHGQASHLGRVTGGGTVQTGVLLHATVTLTAANGDSVNFVADYGPSGPGTWAGTYRIAGGTGRFEGASGDGSFEAVLNPDGTLTGKADGNIAY